MKIKNFLFALAFVLAIAPSAFALQCKNGNYGSDECWTNVQISTVETTPVIAGTVLEFAGTTDSADDNAYIVRVANASADHSAIAGVAQATIATGDSGLVLARGKGKIRVPAGVVATRDYLYASATAGAAGTVPATGAKVAAFALQSSTAGAATIDAYITVV
jgi:hypothetical protein